MFDYVVKKIVGTKNERELRKLAPLVVRTNELERDVEKLSQDAMQARIRQLKEEVRNGRKLDDILPESFALTREASRRINNMRHFDVQLIGGAVLHSGRIAEMRTGEGKTLVATLPAVLNSIEGRGVHVVTVNDYLARRDAEWMGRIYGYLGLTTGVIVNDVEHRQRQEAYRCDITYGQNNEFGFDYLRDNMKMNLKDYVQRELNYAIVDEVDSILIDEARTPLIISGPSEGSVDAYYTINEVIPGLVIDRDYVVDEKLRSVTLTDDGVERVERRLGIKNLYDPDMIETLHHVEQALRAHTLYKKDVNYVVQPGEDGGHEVLIVDENTGRTMPGRRWSDGLHQAIEAKEGVKIESENQTLATISFQNYFRMYSKLSGMTGTADTESAEFADIYNLDVIVVPTHRPMVRLDEQDVVYKSEREKFKAAAEEIIDRHGKGQPILVGTASIAKSEAVSAILKKRGVPHNVLNAKQHEREADIIAQAGRRGAVTIATNMAGRGTDILLGGNADALAKHEVGLHPPERAMVNDPAAPEGEEKLIPESDDAYAARVKDYEDRLAAATAKYKSQVEKEHEEVVGLGGLAIIGTERHESRRIDNQLRGRAGRQGDPGMSRFYMSLEDDLMRIFASDRIAWLMDKMGVKDDEPIEHSMLTKAIANAQQRVEAQHFDSRKHLLEYDDVMNQQRKTIYAMRRRVLAAGAGIPVIEYEEDPADRRKKHKRKIRKEFSVDWPDLRERVLDLIEDAVISVVNEAVPRRKEDWDPGALERLVKEQFGITMAFQGQAPDVEHLQLDIYNRVEKAYLAKEEQIGKEQFRGAEQYFFLQIIDTLWKDHLLTMDHLRQGINLVSYAQKDPRREYKKNGYELFVILLGRISSNVVGTLLRVEPVQRIDEVVRRQREEAEARLRKASETRSDADIGERRPKQQTVTRRTPKVGRNDPCPCGSGKKYKKCHGNGTRTDAGDRDVPETA
jgi:preprotein translocase subunit SecA